MMMDGMLQQWPRSHLKRIVLTALSFLAIAVDFTPVMGAEGSSKETEAGYLLEYVTLICIRSSYARLEPAAPQVVKLLGGEAWVFVEKGSLGPEVYEQLYKLADTAGKTIPPMAAFRGCLQWRGNGKLRKFITEAVANLPG